MALRNQPYFPLYVQDYLTDEKLNLCSAASQGVYIKILCILHKQDDYGSLILYKQKDKQNSSMISNFANMFAKLLPFDLPTMTTALEELIEEKVLIIEGDKLYQKRMVKDGNISLVRSKAGKDGGGNPNLYKQKDKQTSKQNTEDEYVNETEYETKDTTKRYFESHFYQMLPVEHLPIWRQYVDHQTENKIRITQQNVTSHLKAFKECLSNGINPSELLEAFQQSSHKGLYYISKNLIDAKNSGKGNSKQKETTLTLRS